MKTMRYIIALVLACGLLLSLPFAAQAEDSDFLTLDRVVQISDTEMILEFSEPVVLNKFQVNRGPYGALRYVNASNAVGYAINQYNVNGDPLQWEGQYMYINEDHSKLLWRITTNRLGCNTISEIVNISHPDALRSIEKNKLELRFVLEEVPYDQKGITADGKIDNVTTEDGSKYLLPNKPSGWESCIMEVVRDFNYPLDRSKFVGTSSAAQNWDFDVIFKGEGLVVEEEVDGTPVEIVKVLKNDPKVIAMIFGADLVVAALAVLAVVLVLKKKKGKAA